MNNPSLTPAFITASAAFVAAVIAQLISHWLTAKRESRRYYREIYQALYAPILLDVFLYVDLVTHYKRGSDTHVEDEAPVRDKIVAHIGENLRYASPSLISAYYEVADRKYISTDQSGFLNVVDDIKLFLHFLDNLYTLANKIDLFDKDFESRLTRYRIYYLIWLMLMGGDWTAATALLRHKWYFNRKLTNRTYQKLARIPVPWYLARNRVSPSRRRLSALGNRLTQALYLGRARPTTIQQIIKAMTKGKNRNQIEDSYNSRLEYEREQHRPFPQQQPESATTDEPNSFG